VNTMLRAAILMIFGLALMPRIGAAGQWGIGSAIAHFQPSQTGLRSESIAAPYVTYHSERLHVDLGTVSYVLYKSREIQFSMEGELRFDGYDPKDSSALAGMEKRKSSFDAGIGVARAGAWGVMKIMILSDITGAHEGYEARVQYEVPYMINRFLIAPAVGVSWLDDALVDYYYGVRLDEATSTRSQYTGGSTTNTYVHLSLGYLISDSMELLAGLKFVRLGENIEASPIVDKKYETSAFSAVQYKF